MKFVLRFAGILIGLAAALPTLAQVPTTEPPPTERPPVIIRTEPSEEFEFDERERVRPTLSGETFKQRLRYGANFDIPSLSFFGRGNSFFNIGVSPLVGYRVRYGTTAGIGATISYVSQPDFMGGRAKQTSLGGRFFLQQHLTFLDEKIPGLFLWGEVEQFTILSYRDSRGSIRDFQYKPGVLVGGGYGAIAGEPGFQITVLYHTGLNTQPLGSFPYNNPLVLRIGYWFK